MYTMEGKTRQLIRVHLTLDVVETIQYKPKFILSVQSTEKQRTSTGILTRNTNVYW